MKRKVTLFIILVLMFICLVFSVSYAFYNIAPTNKYNVSGTVQIPGCAGIKLSDNKNISLSGDFAVPVQEDRLLNSSQTILNNYKYNFTVRNDCNANANVTFAIALLNNNTMPKEVIKYLLVPEGTTNLIEQLGNVKTLENEREIDPLIKEELGFNDGPNTAFIIKTEQLNADTSKNYDFYIWIDYEENGQDNSTMNKVLSATLILSSYESLGDAYVPST